MNEQLYTYHYHSGVKPEALLLLHGVGGNERDMDQIGQLLGPDSHWLSPKGKITVDGHARYFTRRDDSTFDPVEVRAETDDMAQFIAQTGTNHAISEYPLTAIGYSNGANLIASLIATRPNLIKRAILFRGMLPIEFSDSPNLHGTSILLLNGHDDPIMDPVRVNQLAEYFRDHGADVTQQWLPTGHQLSSDDITIARQWLKR
jgi:phospholipase/carboxylesterase